MGWDFDNDRAIYLQIMDKVKEEIISGNMKPGDRIPSVRDLAAKAAVNPNTVQKAMNELEREGFLFANRTSGRFITDDEELIRSERKRIMSEKIKDFYSVAKSLGYTKEELINLITESDLEE